jgi:type IV pilus assembly protein PilA
MRANRGFTLIELMIVIAILGILLAIAIPAYSDYTIRSKVSEGLYMAASAKSAVSVERSDLGRWPTSNAMAGVSDTIETTYVESIRIAGDGEITITVRNIDAQVDGQTVVLTPSYANSVVTWDCSPGTMETRFLPAVCR